MNKELKKYFNKLLIASFVTSFCLIIFVHYVVGVIALILSILISYLYVKSKTNDTNFIKKLNDPNYAKNTRKTVGRTGMRFFCILAIIIFGIAARSMDKPFNYIAYIIATLCLFGLLYSFIKK